MYQSTERTDVGKNQNNRDAACVHILELILFIALLINGSPFKSRVDSEISLSFWGNILIENINLIFVRFKGDVVLKCEEGVIIKTSLVNQLL